MKAETAEMQVQDRLLVPMLHVERSVVRQTTIVSFEVPDEKLWRMGEYECLQMLYRVMTGLLNTFVTMKGQERQRRAILEENG